MAGARDRFTAISASQASRKLQDRKSTRLNSSHVKISYAVFCLKKKGARLAPRHSSHRVHPSRPRSEDPRLPISFFLFFLKNRAPPESSPFPPPAPFPI